MQKQKTGWTISAVLALALALGGGLTAFVRTQVHAEDAKQHLTRETMQQEYVPRQELDHRLTAQDKALEQIQMSIGDLADDVKDLR